MTLEQALILLAGLIAAILAAYILVMLFQWSREDEPVSEQWEVGCRIRTVHDPNYFLPGSWRINAHYDDGTSEWVRTK